MEANEFSRLVEQYMLLDKKTLAELLALKELAGRLDVPVVPSYPPTPVPIPSNPYPWWPNVPGDYPPYTPWWPQVWYTTKTTDGKEYENWTPSSQCELNRKDVVEDTLTCGSCAANAHHVRTQRENNEYIERIKAMN